MTQLMLSFFFGSQTALGCVKSGCKSSKTTVFWAALIKPQQESWVQGGHCLLSMKQQVLGGEQEQSPGWKAPTREQTW